MAVGEIGMSLDDFDRLTPAEFEAIFRRWASGQERAERAGWEQTRAQVMAALAPYTDRRLTPHEVLPLPWDGEPCAGAASPREELTGEQRAERYRAAVAARGLR